MEERLLALEGDKDQLHMQVILIVIIDHIGECGNNEEEKMLMIRLAGVDAVRPDPQPDRQDP